MNERTIPAAASTLPDFLCIGAQRSGTTWLDRQLRLHPDILLPSDRKEVHYFDRHHDRGEHWYAALFAAPPGRTDTERLVRGEITPMYLFDPEVPARINALLPEVKLVAMLRNPAARAWSHYGHSRRNSNYTADFETFLGENEQAFTRGCYAEQLERYVSLFGRERLRVFVFEEVLADPDRSIAELCDFLGLDRGRMREEVEREKSNESYLPRHAGAYRLAIGAVDWLRRRDLYWVFNLARKLGVSGRLFGSRGAHESMPPDAREALMARYAEDIRRLETLLGRDLDVWRPSPPSAQ